MDRVSVIDGALYSRLIRSAAARMGSFRTTVNDLNVFPIPDGDTGDNMYMTINSGARAAGSFSNLSEASNAVSDGMLTGARGNSGVILSRIFAGIAKGLEGKHSASVSEFAHAMELGIEEAYSAVSKPVEGTILTVYKDAVNAASRETGTDESFENFFTVLVKESKKALERTPNQLAVLKEAGVVDSGGAGLMYIAEGMLKGLSGEADISEEIQTGNTDNTPDLSLFDENSILEYGYCTEFLLRLQNSKVNVASFDEKALFSWLYENGESVVAFRNGSIIKVHIHTSRPGDILNHCQEYGEFLTLKIENMTLQHSENRPAEKEKEPELRLKNKAKYATVAVACGDGVRDMFSSLGVNAVIDGGQSMNPSTGDFIEAFRKVNAETVFVFPNNSNVILAAEQAAKLYKDADIRVIKTRNVGEGYAAMSMMDTAGSPDEIAGNLEDAASEAVTGMVSRACRNTDFNGIEVKSGDYIGFEGKNVLCDAGNRNEAALKLCEKLNAGRKDLLILLRGADTPEAEANELAETLKKTYRRTEIILTYGGQPVHDYILILE